MRASCWRRWRRRRRGGGGGGGGGEGEEEEEAPCPLLQYWQGSCRPGQLGQGGCVAQWNRQRPQRLATAPTPRRQADPPDGAVPETSVVVY